jgi:hypothetical protein
VLNREAVAGKIDYLEGLKENVIVGHRDSCRYRYEREYRSNYGTQKKIINDDVIKRIYILDMSNSAATRANNIELDEKNSSEFCLI